MRRISFIIFYFSFIISLATAQTVKVKLSDYVVKNGTITIGSSISSTKNGAYAVYQVTVPESGLYDAYALFGTTKSGSSLAVDMDVDLTSLQTRDPEKPLTKATTNPNDWNARNRYTFGPFRLRADSTYYLRIYFIQTSSSNWVGNVHELGLKKSTNQEQTDIVEVDVEQEGGYRLYALDGSSSSTIYPFWRGWAWEPNYIEKKEDYIEFYYNQAALDADNNSHRQRRGAEVTCGFSTNSEGWYGFRFYLPEGQFPKDVSGSIFCQIFNSGPGNTWAGHLSLNQNKVVLSHRKASVSPTTRTVGTVEWDTWIPVVVYFKAGRNNKGRIRVWIGDDMVESKPKVDTGNIGFGFGTWIDDEHMNNVLSDDNPTPTSLGCKFGLYVSSGGNRTIRFDDIKVIEGNPEGAFEIVKPTVTTTGISRLTPQIDNEPLAAKYDLSGRKVSDSSVQGVKGIHIVNGKKVVVK